MQKIGNSIVLVKSSSLSFYMWLVLNVKVPYIVFVCGLNLKLEGGGTSQWIGWGTSGLILCGISVQSLMSTCHCWDVSVWHPQNQRRDWKITLTHDDICLKKKWCLSMYVLLLSSKFYLLKFWQQQAKKVLEFVALTLSIVQSPTPSLWFPCAGMLVRLPRAGEAKKQKSCVFG